jgi:hypothetical protein
MDNTIVATWAEGTPAYTTSLHLGESADRTPKMSNWVYATLAADGSE